MKREILFRGKRVDNGEWIYGFLVIDPKGKYRIYWKPFEDATSNTYHFVIPETVGQFSGLCDKNGVKIFEGDAIATVERDVVFRVYFGKCYHCVSTFFIKTAIGHPYPLDKGCSTMEVIGNIHDNQELK